MTVQSSRAVLRRSHPGIAGCVTECIERLSGHLASSRRSFERKGLPAFARTIPFTSFGIVVIVDRFLRAANGSADGPRLGRARSPRWSLRRLLLRTTDSKPKELQRRECRWLLLTREVRRRLSIRSIVERKPANRQMHPARTI
jgi:hypothetical protein